MKVSKDTFSILQASLDVAEETGGAFDPTPIYPLSSLWDFGGDNQQVPAREEIDAFLPYVNYQDLALNDAACTARLRMELEAVDLGAAGKGAACDAALQAYRRRRRGQRRHRRGRKHRRDGPQAHPGKLADFRAGSG